MHNIVISVVRVHRKALILTVASSHRRDDGVKICGITLNCKFYLYRYNRASIRDLGIFILQSSTGGIIKL